MDKTINDLIREVAEGEGEKTNCNLNEDWCGHCSVETICCIENLCDICKVVG
jgi:hypothetical protein